MKKQYKWVLYSICIIATVLCVVPIMSIYMSSGESGMLVIRGYNLLEFSAWGSIPVLTPIIVLSILFSSQPKVIKEMEFLLLCVINMVCYVYSFNVARTWLYYIGDTQIIYHIGMFCYPMGVIIVILLPVVLGAERRITNDF